MTVQPTRDQLRALANAATEGPWNPHPAGKYVWTEELGGIIQNWSDDANAVADMEFIAAARTAVPQLLDQADRAEHRIARLEAQTDIRGRAVVMYRKRAREAEAERDEWRQTALDERGAALDLIEQVKIRDARIKAVRDVLDQAEASISHHPAYTFSGQRMDPIVNGADIRRALESVPPPRA